MSIFAIETRRPAHPTRLGREAGGRCRREGEKVSSSLCMILSRDLCTLYFYCSHLYLFIYFFGASLFTPSSERDKRMVCVLEPEEFFDRVRARGWGKFYYPYTEEEIQTYVNEIEGQGQN